MIAFSKIPLKFIAILMIVVVGAYSLNTIFNTHSHILEDGTIITHAHPFDHSSDTDPFKSHTHTSVELIYLANLTYFLPAFLFFLATVTLAKITYCLSYRQIGSSQYLFQIPPLRGPPFLVF